MSAMVAHPDSAIALPISEQKFQYPLHAGFPPAASPYKYAFPIRTALAPIARAFEHVCTAADATVDKDLSATVDHVERPPAKHR